MMSKQDIFELAVKLFGIYCFILFLQFLMTIGAAFSMETSEFVSNVTLYRISFCTMPLIYLIVSLLLVFKGRAIAHMLAGGKTEILHVKEEAVPTYGRLSFWIILIGVFYFVSSASKIVSDAIAFPITHTGIFWWSRFLSQALILVLSLVFIFGSKTVEHIVQGKPAQGS